MSEKKKRIGIMGGTFDPIHIGHLILGETAYHQFHLDNVLFMPAGNPPHKQDRENRATDSQRVEMVRLAIASNPHFTLSMEEMHREGYSYTYRTLERLKKRYPDTEYYFILGADSLYTFDEWKEPARILGACTILVGTRNHTSDEKLERCSFFSLLILETKRIYRAYFSAITAPDIFKAMRTLKDPDVNQAHAVDG